MKNHALNKFYIQHKEKINDPVVKAFLKKKENKELLLRAINNPSYENKEMLDNAFKKHYKNVKIISYISKLIHFYSIDLYKKNNLYSKRYPLIYNHSFKNENDKNPYEFESTLKSLEDSTFNTFQNLQDSIKDYITDEQIFYSLKLLSEKQLKILNYKFIYNYSNKEIAQIIK
ncbi:sigma-70 family RNA polymerase sigma factor [Gottfriedia sp. NPDC058432]|uniref:sigma-70 family RNA polymerase sigma factor n=1 Tax=Gottfriedia sp. NPDC058432 TaxID=3346497 RepID=UPI00364B094F